MTTAYEAALERVAGGADPRAEAAAIVSEMSVAERIDWQKTYLNCFTAGPSGVRRARMPMVLPDEDACVRAALSMCGRAIDEPKRVVRIRSTLHLTTCWVSDALLGELPPGAQRL